MVTKKPHSAEPQAAVHAADGDALLSLSADVSSAAASKPSATLVVAGTRGDAPREVDPSLVVDYECESDEMADSQRRELSPLSQKKADRRRELSLSILGEDSPPTPVISRMPSPAQSPVRGKHDDVSHRGKGGGSSIPVSVDTTGKRKRGTPTGTTGKYNRGTPASVGTYQGSSDSKVSTLPPEKKPWQLPERLVNSLSGETALTINIPYLLRVSSMGLLPALRNLVLRRTSTSMLFLGIDGIMGIISETKSR